jgi:hypothetical protein
MLAVPPTARPIPLSQKTRPRAFGDNLLCDRLEHPRQGGSLRSSFRSRKRMGAAMRGGTVSPLPPLRTLPRRS